MGIPVPDHRSSPFLTEVHARADLILAMTPSHVATLRDAHPEIADSIRLLDTDGAGISDPIGGDREVYEDCLSMIQSALEERLAELRSLIPPTDRGPAPV